eukprot:2226663-Amphidinium_carterae.1
MGTPVFEEKCFTIRAFFLPYEYVLRTLSCSTAECVTLFFPIPAEFRQQAWQREFSVFGVVAVEQLLMQAITVEGLPEEDLEQVAYSMTLCSGPAT